MKKLPTRIGLLVPTRDPVVEHDFQRFLPGAVSFHVERPPESADGKTATDEGLTLLCDAAPVKAKPLVALGAELVVFCCTSGSFFKGHGWDRELASIIESAVGVTALTTSTAVAQAFGALGTKRAFMVTPYPEKVNAREQAFFGAHGVEINTFTSFECAQSHEIDKITAHQIVKRVLANRQAIETCDAVFISCTALRSMDTIELLERELDKPIVTSNASTIWATLRRLGVDTNEVPGGRLYRLPPEAKVARHER